jgi:hypothetical protein
LATDVVQLVESRLQKFRFVKIASDILQISENRVTKTFTTLVKIASDGLRFGEGVVKKTATQLTKIVADTLRIVEGSVRKVRIIKVINEVERISEGIIRKLRANVVIGEILRISEAISRRMRATKVVNEIMLLIDNSFLATGALIVNTFFEILDAIAIALGFKAKKPILEFIALSQFPMTFSADKGRQNFRATEVNLIFDAYPKLKPPVFGLGEGWLGEGPLGG